MTDQTETKPTAIDAGKLKELVKALDELLDDDQLKALNSTSLIDQPEGVRRAAEKLNLHILRLTGNPPTGEMIRQRAFPPDAVVDGAAAARDAVPFEIKAPTLADQAAALAPIKEQLDGQGRAIAHLAEALEKLADAVEQIRPGGQG